MKSAVGIVFIAGVNAQVPWQALAPSEESIDGFSPAQKHHAATTYSKPKTYYEPKEVKPTVRMIRRPKWPLLHPGKSYIPAAKTVGTVPSDIFIPTYGTFATAPATAKQPSEHGLPLAIHGLNKIRSIKCLEDKTRNPFYKCPDDQMVGGPLPKKEHTETATSVPYFSFTIMILRSNIFTRTILIIFYVFILRFPYKLFDVDS